METLLKEGIVAQVALFVLSACLLSTDIYGQASVISGSVSNSKTNYSPGAGNNRLIVVAVSNENNNNVRTVTSITWGGQALTFAAGRTNAGAGANDLRAEIWYLDEAGINAASGYCNDFVVTWSGATTEVFTVVTLQDVDQATPVAATGTGSPAAGGTTATTSGMAAGVNDISYYASATRANATHTPPANYTELSDQVVSATTALATAYKQITSAGTETPTATWSGSDQLVIVGVVFNGVTATGGVTYYSRNATSGGNWNSNTSWTTNADGSGGPLAAGEWPRRFDNVVILSGHTITIDAIDDNKSCGVSPDGLGRSNVGPFVSSNIAMFYQTGDITIAGTLNVTGIEMMVEGYTHILSGGTFSLASNLVNLGFLEADAGSTLSSLDDLVLTGTSNTIINTTATSTDDLVIDHTQATLCGSGSQTLQNGAGSQITYTNGATVAQICTSFTITCTGIGCTGFPVTGTGTSFGNTGPGGVQSTNGTSNLTLWLNVSSLTQADNTNVTSWTDLSGYGNHANAVGGNEPVFRTNIINGNPTVRFVSANTDYLRVTDAASLRPNTISIFLIGRYNTTSSAWSPFVIKATNDNWTDGYAITRNNNLNSLYTFVTTWNTNFVTSSLAAATFTSITSVYDKSTIEMFYNEASQGTDNFTSNITNSTNFLYVGIGPDPAGTGIARPLDGDISELVIINRDVSLVERIIINNYLAAKYGLSLSANDFYTMDNPANGNYDFDVAGIGQASDGSRHVDARGTGIVRMVVQSPASLSNNEYLFWGHENGSLNSNFIDIDNVIIKERLTRVWRVSETGDVGSVSLSFDITSLPGSPIAADLRLLIDRDGDGFADNDVTPVGGAQITGRIVTFNGINLQNGDRFTLGNTNLAAPLPVELVFFRAKANGGQVDLTWRTASETNNDYFTVERSADAGEWTTLATVPGKGNSTTRTDYGVVDDNPVTGTNYYRLKQTDFDGTFTYSAVVSAFVEFTESIHVYPNPARESFTIKASFQLDATRIQLYDQLGKQVRVVVSSAENGNRLEVDSSSLTPGLYILQVTNGKVLRSVRVIIR
ncbi:MAG: T9SS type A sorting domain-containing protein [Cyclobacteriaceae bacterium]